MRAIAASEPWAFTQEHPLTTRDFCKEAARRGVDLDHRLLRELWRIGALAPIAEVRRSRVGDGRPSPVAEPCSAGTTQMEVLRARNSGRLADPLALGFRHQLRFDRPRSTSVPDWRWWNGLIYSRWQLLALDRFRSLLARVPPVNRGGKPSRLPPLNDYGRNEAVRMRRLSELLVALEARYLPEIKYPWVHLSGATFAEWDAYRRQFAPGEVLARLDWTPEQVARAADKLLLSVRWREPCRGGWSQLIRRADQKAWEHLSGAALAVLDTRIAAEMLLRCYEHMADLGETRPLAHCPDWFSFQEERLSHTGDSLDGNLSSLGLSPHPGVVLVVEGETEEYLVPRVRDRLRMADGAGIVRPVVMRGTKAGLKKLVAFAAGPLIERRQGDEWLLATPPARIVVAVDPDKPFHTPENAEAERREMVDELVLVIRAQGVEPQRDDLDHLVRVETWSESCFEFAHFTDAELASVLTAVHRDCGGLSEVRLAEELARRRRSGHDIKQVWPTWRPRLSKRMLAEALWPVLERKIAAAEDDPAAPVPEIVVKLEDAYHEAAQRPAGRWLLRGRFIEVSPP